MPRSRRKLLGRHVVADPKICHGQLTFVGTRILVADVLEMVARGMAWSKICKECHGSIDDQAIAEAIRLAGRAFQRQVEHSLVETTPS
jgi:uncharacterized protein (DUF433 family)